MDDLGELWAAPDWPRRLRGRIRAVSLTDLTRRHRHSLPALGVLPVSPSLTLRRTFPEACRVLGGSVLGSEGRKLAPGILCPSVFLSRFSFLAHLHPPPVLVFNPGGSSSHI